jgi:hypothetical protein
MKKKASSSSDLMASTVSVNGTFQISTSDDTML